MTDQAPFNRQHHSYLQGAPLAGDYPIYLVIETTSVCNLTCPMCPWPELNRAYEHMSYALYQKLVLESAGHVEFAYLHFMGEPLIHPKLAQMIDFAEQHNVRTGLSTNAMLLNEARARALLDSRLSLLILSVDATNEADYAKYRTGGNLKLVKQNIHRFLEMKERSRSRLAAVVQMIDLGQPHAEKAAFFREWNRRADVVIKPYQDWGQQSVRITRAFGVSESTSSEHGRCPEPWRGALVCSDGRVVPCCMDFDATIVLGNLSTQSLREIWSGDAYRAFRTAHATCGDVPNACVACSMLHHPMQQSWESLSYFKPYNREIASFTQRPLLPAEPQYTAGPEVAFSDEASVRYLSAGWYASENVGRWMDERGAVHLDLGKDARHIELDFSVYHPDLSAEHPLHLSLCLGNSPAVSVNVESPGRHATGPVPIVPALRGRRVVLWLEVDRSYTPMLHHETSNDTRRLGILAHRLRIG